MQHRHTGLPELVSTPGMSKVCFTSSNPVFHQQPEWPAPKPILYQNQDATITLIDIPRSIEAVQGTSSEPWNKRLLSSPAVENPYPSAEPRSKKALAALPEVSIEDLLLQKHVQFALEEVKSSYNGEWCLPRVIASEEESVGVEKRKMNEDVSTGSSKQDESPPKKKSKLNEDVPAVSELLNPLKKHEPPPKLYHFPPKSSKCQANVEDQSFPKWLPPFHLIIMDPPWPNRSVRRSKRYDTSPDIRHLLFSLNIRHHLRQDGLLGVWITNRAAFRDLVLGPGGLFAEWGVELVEEWIWLKVTKKREPIVPLGATWRKPYEILLVAKKVAIGEEKGNVEVKRRVIVGVPDLHSRKPNLQVLFDPLLEEGYSGLEIFARNMARGWWAWGNEASKFQHSDYWSDKPWPPEVIEAYGAKDP